MTKTPSIWRIALYLSPVILVMGGLFAATPWLKSMDDTVVLLLAAVAAIFVTGYGVYLEARVHRTMDEVQRASHGYSAKWGGTIGSSVFVLLLLFPPFQAFMTGVVNNFAADPGTTVDETVVVFSMVMGFAGVTLLSAVSTIAMNIAWWVSWR